MVVSGSELTATTFVIGIWVGDTTSASEILPPTGMVPRLQVTSPLATEQEAGVDETKVVPDGSVSTMVTFVPGLGPELATVTVYCSVFPTARGAGMKTVSKGAASATIASDCCFVIS